MGLNTARRIKELADEVHIKIARALLVGNNYPLEMEEDLREYASSIGVEYCGAIPYDPEMAKYNVRGLSLLNLPDTSLAVRRVEEMATRMGLLS
jgi:CO dehydrogenase nickel-insertion accessory protein CooC1